MSLFWVGTIAAQRTDAKSFTPGTKQLRLDRVGKRALYYEAGEEITFKLKGQDEFITLQIIDLLPQDGIILFPTLGMVRISDIDVIKPFFHKKPFARGLAKMLNIFAANWSLYTTYIVLSNLGSWSALTGYITPAIAVATGWLLKKILFSRRYKLGKNSTLRIIDLQVKPLEIRA